MNLNYFLITLKKINGFNRQKVIAWILNLPIESIFNLTPVALVSTSCFWVFNSFQEFSTIKNSQI
jgi:hypothetical protein